MNEGPSTRSDAARAEATDFARFENRLNRLEQLIHRATLAGDTKRAAELEAARDLAVQNPWVADEIVAAAILDATVGGATSVAGHISRARIALEQATASGDPVRIRLAHHALEDLEESARLFVASVNQEMRVGNPVLSIESVLARVDGAIAGAIARGETDAAQRMIEAQVVEYPAISRRMSDILFRNAGVLEQMRNGSIIDVGSAMSPGTWPLTFHQEFIIGKGERYDATAYPFTPIGLSMPLTDPDTRSEIMAALDRGDYHSVMDHILAIPGTNFVDPKLPHGVDRHVDEIAIMIDTGTPAFPPASPVKTVRGSEALTSAAPVSPRLPIRYAGGGEAESLAATSDAQSAAEPQRARKRSFTIQPEIDAAIVERIGPGEYSKFVNEALLMALQARGIAESVAEFEQQHGPLTEEDHARGEQRTAEADANLAAFLASRQQ